MRTPPSTAPSSPRSPISPDGDWIGAVARIGLVAYAVVYLLLGWLAVQLAFGNHEGKPSSSGALQELAQQPLGGVLIWLVAGGMFLLVVWQLLEAAFGYRDEDGAKRTGQRLVSLGRAIVWGALGGLAVRVAVSSSGGSDKSQKAWTARVMDLPAGQLLVGLVGLAILGYGVGQVYLGWSDRFAKQLDGEGRRGATGTAYLTFGRIGYTAKGIVFGIVGALFGYAAITHDPKKSGGIDQALLEVLQKPFGPVLLCVMGVGLVCFGLFQLARARHLAR